MLTGAHRSDLQARAALPPDLAELRAAALSARNPDCADARVAIAAALAHVAFAAPERLVEVYDVLARAWLDEPIAGPSLIFAEAEPLPIPEEFWDAFWTLRDAIAAGGMGAGDVTRRTATLGSSLHPEFHLRAASAALSFVGVAEAAASGTPPRLSMQALAQCAPGSLGEALHRLVTDHGFDLEPLDRDTLNLDLQAAPQNYLSARMLQSHDLWHLVAGYETTGLHEIAISAFQMAQFGQPYSAILLAGVMVGASVREDAFVRMLHTVVTGWKHGRETPPMIGIPWEEVWDLPVEEVRERYGVRPYASPYPADLVERLRAA
ncbi:MAG: Coq4 family protein [Caulobacterales bacterium]